MLNAEMKGECGCGKTISKLAPEAWPVHPFRGDVAQREPDQLRGGFVSREMATGFDDLPQLRVDAFERVGRVDQAPDVGRKREERNDVRPGAAPGGDDRRKLPAPRPALEGVERGTRRLGARGGVDRPQRRRHRLALFPIREVQTVANQVHDAGLQRGLRETPRRAPRSCP